MVAARIRYRARSSICATTVGLWVADGDSGASMCCTHPETSAKRKTHEGCEAKNTRSVCGRRDSNPQEFPVVSMTYKGALTTRLTKSDQNHFTQFRVMDRNDQ